MLNSSGGAPTIVSEDGHLYLWGNAPTLESSTLTTSAVATGAGGWCAIRQSGDLVCNGPLASGGYGFSQPTTITGLGTVRALVAGMGHVCVLSDLAPLTGVVSCLHRMALTAA